MEIDVTQVDFAGLAIPEDFTPESLARYQARLQRMED